MTQGLTTGPALADWAARARAGADVAGSGTVVMRDDDGRPAATWRLHRMRPSAIAAAGAPSAGGEVVVDVLELTPGPAGAAAAP
jgi:sugar lactone lactonase YvrE